MILSSEFGFRFHLKALTHKVNGQATSACHWAPVSSVFAVCSAPLALAESLCWLFWLIEHVKSVSILHNFSWAFQYVNIIITTWPSGMKKATNMIHIQNRSFVYVLYLPFWMINIDYCYLLIQLFIKFIKSDSKDIYNVFFFFFFFFFFGLSVAQITHDSTYAWLYYHHSQPFFFFFFLFFFFLFFLILIKYIYIFFFFFSFSFPYIN